MQIVMRRLLNRIQDLKSSQDAEDILGLNQLDFFVGKATHAALRNCEQLGEVLAIPYAAQRCISTAENVSIVPIYEMRHRFLTPSTRRPYQDSRISFNSSCHEVVLLRSIDLSASRTPSIRDLPQPTFTKVNQTFSDRHNCPSSS